MVVPSLSETNRPTVSSPQLVGLPRHPEEVTGAAVGARHASGLAVAAEGAGGGRFAVGQRAQAPVTGGRTRNDRVQLAVRDGHAALVQAKAVTPTSIAFGRVGRWPVGADIAKDVARAVPARTQLADDVS